MSISWHCSVQARMLQLPSNSARNLHGNSAGSAGGRAPAAHPRGDTRGQPPRHGHTSLCWPPSTARGTGALPGEREPRGAPGSGVQPAPTLCGGSHCCGVWKHTDKLLEQLGKGRHICSSEITRPSSDARGGGINTAHSAGEHTSNTRSQSSPSL